MMSVFDVLGQKRPDRWPTQIPVGVNPRHPEYRREGLALVAMSGMDVRRAEFARWLYDHDRIDNGESREHRA